MPSGDASEAAQGFASEKRCDCCFGKGKRNGAGRRCVQVPVVLSWPEAVKQQAPKDAKSSPSSALALEKLFVQVDVPEEFPFQVTKLSLYYNR